MHCVGFLVNTSIYIFVSMELCTREWELINCYKLCTMALRIYLPAFSDFCDAIIYSSFYGTLF